jgi:hypothetical protein
VYFNEGLLFTRNISIALVCIFVTTLCTLGSWRGSLFVMMCVLFTCIDVAGQEMPVSRVTSPII